MTAEATYRRALEAIRDYCDPMKSPPIYPATVLKMAEAALDPRNSQSEPLSASELLGGMPLMPASEAVLDAFLAGLDSPWHSKESRREWVRLFIRDVAAGRIKP